MTVRHTEVRLKESILGASVIAFAAAAGLFALPSSAHEEEWSVGRGWPVAELSAELVGPISPASLLRHPVALGGETPEGIQPLERDIFTTENFYMDSALWSDPRYFRCNSPYALDAQWGDYPGTTSLIQSSAQEGAWGHCDRDYPRSAIISPYPFSSAQEHYEALLQEVQERGGPTRYSRNQPPPAWDGNYSMPLHVRRLEALAGNTDFVLPEEWSEPPQWIVGEILQVSTLASLLTPLYQQRLVQQFYHQVQNRASQWSLQYCRPEGLLRWWSAPGTPNPLDVTVTPERVTLLGTWGSQRFIYIDRDFSLEGPVPRLGPDVLQWYGESVGFWDQDVLVSWTSNVQGFFTHASFEHSNSMQTIEIWSPRHGADGELLGLEHEAIFYDPEALVEPVRNVRFFVYRSAISEGPAQTKYHCNQMIFPVEGRGIPHLPGDRVEIEVEDLYGRPWAHVWEQYFEKDMDRPADGDGELFGF